MLFVEMSTKMALGAVVTHAPSVTDFDSDPFALIKTGDWVQVDADRGEVRVWRAGS
jgi:predicted aconitase with swiveling domain